MSRDPYDQRLPLINEIRALEGECAELRSQLQSVAVEFGWREMLLKHRFELQRAIREEEDGE